MVMSQTLAVNMKMPFQQIQQFEVRPDGLRPTRNNGSTSLFGSSFQNENFLFLLTVPTNLSLPLKSQK
jgi:hypothetical protein